MICVAAISTGIFVTTVLPELSLIILTTIVLLIPLIVKSRAGQFDILEPIVWINLTFLLMYVIRPVALLLSGDFEVHGSYDIRDAMMPPLTAALLGSVGLFVGYISPFGKAFGKSLKAPRNVAYEATLIVFATALILLAIIAALQFADRQGSVGFGTAAGGEGTTAYLYMMPLLLIPGVLLFLHTGFERRSRMLQLLGGCLLLLAIVTLTPSGRRLTLVLTVLSVVIYLALRFSWRPPFYAVALALIPTLIVFDAMRENRRPETSGQISSFVNELVWSATHFTQVARTFILNWDTEMFDMLAVITSKIPSQQAYSPGSVVVDIFLQPIPRMLWAGKPLPIVTKMNDLAFGSLGFRAGARSAGTSPSILGSFYYDSGFIGVLIGSVVYGILARTLWDYLKHHSDNDFVRMIFSSSLILLTASSRGAPQIMLGYAVFTVVPIVLAGIVAGRRAPTSQFR